MQRQTWNSEVRYHTEAEMAQHFRDHGVRAILDLGYAKYRPLEEMQALHDYAFDVERQHRDVILGHWIHVDPQRTPDGVKELRRCIDKRQGFLGFAVSASLTPPASDPLFDPYWCVVGTTGLGAGLPAGGGVMLENCHPRHLDDVAARYPGLQLVTVRMRSVRVEGGCTPSTRTPCSVIPLPSALVKAARPALPALPQMY